MQFSSEPSDVKYKVVEENEAQTRSVTKKAGFTESTLVGRTKDYLTKRFDKQSRFFFRNSKWLLSSNLTRSVIAFTRSIVIARGLGIELFGTYAVLIAFVTTVQELFNMQIGTAIIKFGADYKKAGDRKHLNLLMQCGYLVTLVAIIASIIIIALLSIFFYSLFIDIPGLTVYLILYAVGAGLLFFEEPCISALRLFYRFKVNAIVSITMALLELIIIASILFLWPENLAMLIVASTIAAVINFLVMNLSMLWELRHELSIFERIDISALVREWKKIWRFVVGTHGSRGLKVLIYRGDVLLLAAFAGPVQVGYYAIALKLGSTLKVLTDPLNYTIYPQLASLVSGKQFDELKSLIRNATGVLLIPFALFVALVVLLGNSIVGLIYGAEYTGAADPLILVVAAVAIEALLFWSTALLNSLELIAVRFKTYAVSAIVGFSLAWILIPAYGAVGMAAVLLIVNLLIQVGFVLAAQHKMLRITV